jgi:hypothetical protein
MKLYQSTREGDDKVDAYRWVVARETMLEELISPLQIETGMP